MPKAWALVLYLSLAWQGARRGNAAGLSLKRTDSATPNNQPPKTREAQQIREEVTQRCALASKTGKRRHGGGDEVLEPSSEPNRWCAGRQSADSPRRCGPLVATQSRPRHPAQTHCRRIAYALKARLLSQEA